MLSASPLYIILGCLNTQLMHIPCSFKKIVYAELEIVYAELLENFEIFLCCLERSDYEQNIVCHHAFFPNHPPFERE